MRIATTVAQLGARCRSYLGSMSSSTATARPHRHGRHVHAHSHQDAHRHVRYPQRSGPANTQHHDREHGHSHGLVDRSIVRSRDGVRTVSISLAVLALAAGAQAAIFAASGSVALLADLIHNFGDALTAVPLGIAFFLGSRRGEKLAGYVVVLAIFVSACIALYETIDRLINPRTLTHLWVLASAGVIGFVGNEIAAQVRLRGGRRLDSPALIADGNHARVDAFVSLGVVASAVVVALGFPRGDPIIGLIITLVILKITWDSWRTISASQLRS
jgi:divalent metal cation (Fe/Co/Zn/Cd) transporter